MSIENKVELLWKAAKILQNGQQTQKLLKSYYVNTCRKLVKNNLQIPKEKFAVSQMCPYCSSFWNDSEFGLKLIPKQLKHSSKANRLIEIYDKKDGTTSKVLNKKQRNRAKWLKKKMFNHLSIKCCQCKHISVLKMENQKRKPLEPVTNKKKEKEPSTITSKNASVKCNKSLKFGPDSKRGQNGQILSSASIKSKKEEKSIKISRSKKKTKSNNVVSNKVTSKTQKHNSLLQLAALLKEQSKKDLKSSAQKKLQSFLK